jgi:hypothetical protein
MAINEAVKVENKHVINKLICELLPAEELNQISENYKEDILINAVGTGNLELVDCLLKSQAAPKSIDYFKILSIACEKNYLRIILTLKSHATSKNINLSQILNSRVLDMDRLMLTALSNENYDLAIILIVYGANPEKISAFHPKLNSFNIYLKKKETDIFERFFTESADFEMINNRSEVLKPLKDKYSGKLHKLFVGLINFLNKIFGLNLSGFIERRTAIVSVSEEIITKTYRS